MNSLAKVTESVEALKQLVSAVQVALAAFLDESKPWQIDWAMPALRDLAGPASHWQDHTEPLRASIVRVSGLIANEVATAQLSDAWKMIDLSFTRAQDLLAEQEARSNSIGQLEDAFEHHFGRVFDFGGSAQALEEKLGVCVGGIAEGARVLLEVARQQLKVLNARRPRGKRTAVKGRFGQMAEIMSKAGKVLTKAEMARELDLHPSRLSHEPLKSDYAKARAATMESLGTQVPKGRKKSDGTLEAFSDDE